ncbi:MAG: hypothetical protein JSS95_11715 [Acidobacteria bacterium]|nr:hypothetical protein [Acidobacteriota bacterium]
MFICFGNSRVLRALFPNKFIIASPFTRIGKRHRNSWRDYVKYFAVAIALLAGLPCSGWAQYDFLPQVGIKTFATYQNSEIDSVDLSSGNVNLHIPLVGFPQIGGKLRLNFVVRYNEPQWMLVMGAVQGSQGGTYPFVSSGFWKLNLNLSNARPLGVVVSRDQGVSSYENDTDRIGYLSDGTQVPYTVSTFGIRDKSGAEHVVGVNTGNAQAISFQSPDGSGWRPIAGVGYQDKDGLIYTPHSAGVSGTTLSTWDISDAHGHTIVSDANGWLDSMGRRIPGAWQGPGAGFFGSYPPLEQDPYPGVVTSDLSHCDSTAISARQWVVPTSTDAGGTQSYYFCYSTYSGKTAFNFLGLVDGSIYLKADDQPTSAVLLSRIVLPNNTFYSFQYDPNFLELIGVNLPTGGSVSYEWSTKIWDGCSTSLPVKRMVTKRTVTSDSGTSVWTYKWDSGNCNAAPGDAPDVIISRPDGNDEWHHRYVANSIADPSHWIVDTYAGATNGDPVNAIGTLLKRVETFTSFRQSPLFQANPSAPSGSDANGNPTWYQDGSVHEYFPGPVEKTITTLYDKTSQQIQTSQETDTIPVASTGTLTYWNPDNYSNPQANQCTPCTHYNDIATVRDYDLVQGSGSGPGTLLKRTETSYRFQDSSGQAYANAGMTSLPSQVQVFDGSGTQVAQTKYSYDDPGYSSNVTAGELTSTTKWIDASSSVQAFNYYSADGTWAGSKDAKGNLTTVTSFDCSGLFPSQVTSASGTSVAESVTYSHDCNTGKVVSYQDANGKTTTYHYADPLDRIRTVDFPDGGHVTVNYTDGANSAVNVVTDTGGPQGVMSQTASYDLLGRTVKVQTSTGSDSISVDTTYDPMGRVSSTSNPYSSTEGSASDKAINTYDALGRLHIRTNQDGTTQTINYSGNVTTTTDEATNSWQRTVDGLGRLIQVVEPNGAATNYTYTARGDLASVTQPGLIGETARNRYFFYDWLSRLDQTYNPESGWICYGYGSNPDIGGPKNCNPDYDANGNVLHKTDGRGVLTSYSYDALNRLTQKSYSDGTPTATFGYDGKMADGTALSTVGITSNNSLGRLSAMNVGSDFGQAYSYDEMGRITLETYKLPNSNQLDSVNAWYDLSGNLVNIRYPNGYLISQGWDVAGRLTSSALVNVAGTPQSQSYLQSAQYHPDGTPASFTLGNGAIQTFTENNRLQPQSITVGSTLSSLGTSPFFSHTYCYSNCVTGGGGTANNGNIWRIQDNLNAGLTQDFVYDSLNRIRRFSLGGAAYQDFSIDSFGNSSPAAVNGPAVFSFDPGTNQVSNLQCASYVTQAFDGSGNQMCDMDPNGAARKYAYDAESRIGSLSMASSSTPFETYSYLPDGSRMGKNGADGSSTGYVTFGGSVLAERNQDGAWTNYIYANGGRIARVDANDMAMHAHGTATSTAAGSSASWLIHQLDGYTVKAGDKLSWRQYQSNVTGGIQDIFFWVCGSNYHRNNVDTNGQVINYGSAQNVWQQRTMDLSAFAGCMVQTFRLGTWNFSNLGDWDIWFADMALTSGDGTVVPLYNRQSSVAADFYSNSANVTNPSFTVDSTTVPTDSGMNYATTFYAGDHLGTAQLEISFGGWPVWKGTYSPYGMELTSLPTSNHFKFTGKERDTESGNDYFGARYYGSSMGRFMSPDWSDKAEPVPYAKLDNPQSLNLYGYVNNNPLSHADADGHCCESDFNSFTDHPGRFAGGQTAYDRQFASTLTSTTKAILGVAVVAYAGPEVLAEAGVARTLGQSTNVAVKALGVAGAGVNAAADSMSAVTGKDVDTGTNHVTAVTNPLAALVSATLGSASAGSNANDAVTAGKAITAVASGKSVGNPAEALGSLGGAVDALKSTAKAIGSYITGPPNLAAPQAPKPPGCSVAGACP